LGKSLLSIKEVCRRKKGTGSRRKAKEIGVTTAEIGRGKTEEVIGKSLRFEEGKSIKGRTRTWGGPVKK